MYRSVLDFKETQIAIKQVKDYFQKELAEALNLMRVTAPLMVTRDSGLNDCLNGTERPVQFDLLETKQEVQIVQSLAKWKRFALGKYGFGPGEGLYTVLDLSFEISSMGIRVDEASLAAQLAEAGCEDRRELPFHKAILEGKLPYTIGGGIGQSRLCMYFLDKKHIGEVQVSVWPAEEEERLRREGCYLL